MSSRKRSGVRRREQEAINQGDLYRSQKVAQLREKVEKLSAQQVELSEQREEVLVDRQNFVQSAARVHEQISRSANAAANLMNVFRRHYNELGTTLPAELINAYTTLDEEKDKLGSLEAEHLKTEDDLGALEWNFMELENDLYQYDLHQLLSDEELDDDSPRAQEPSHTMAKTPDPISASTAIQYQVASTEYNRLTNRFKILREEVTERLVDDASDLGIDETELLELANSGFVQTFSDMLTQIADCEVKLKHLKGELISHRDAPSVTSRRLSEPAPYTGKLSFDSDMVSRVHSDGGVPDSVENVPTLHRVKEWLLDCLKQNALEKTQYLGILQQALAYIDIVEPDLTNWEVLATQQWSFDMIEPTEVPCIGMRRSTQGTLRIDDMEETQKAFDQTYDDQHHASVASRYSGQGRNSNLLSDLALEGPLGDHDHPRYPLSETLNITESLIDVDENLISGEDDISQLQQAPAHTNIQEDTRSAFPNVNIGIARTHWDIKKAFFQGPGMERIDSLSPSIAYPKDTALDSLKEPRITLENVYEPISGMISGISSPPVRHSVSRPLVERTYRYDAPSGTALIPHKFEPGGMENNQFCDQFIHTSLPPILPYGYRIHHPIDNIIHQAPIVETYYHNYGFEFHEKYNYVAATKGTESYIDGRLPTMPWLHAANKPSLNQLHLSTQTWLSEHKQHNRYEELFVVRHNDNGMLCQFFVLQPYRTRTMHCFEPTLDCSIYHTSQCSPILTFGQVPSIPPRLWTNRAKTLPPDFRFSCG